jgi:beta-glucosidase
VHAPGHTDPAESLAAAHHLLLGHGLAVRALRAALPAQAQVSLVLNLTSVRAVSADPADQRAARRIDGLANRLFLDPVLRGGYPQDVVADTATVCDWTFVQDGDEETIAAPIDVLGINYYQPTLVGAQQPADGERPPSPYPGCDDIAMPTPPGPLTAMGWPVDASGLRELLLRLRDDYGQIPLLITENGAAYDDTVSGTGAVHDPERTAYLASHLRASHEAIAAGVDLRGYFVWSLMDNFEWALGYSKRFGIVHIDYATQQRTVKDSGLWYRDVIAAHGIPAS